MHTGPRPHWRSIHGPGKQRSWPVNSGTKKGDPTGGIWVKSKKNRPCNCLAMSSPWPGWRFSASVPGHRLQLCWYAKTGQVPERQSKKTWVDLRLSWAVTSRARVPTRKSHTFARKSPPILTKVKWWMYGYNEDSYSWAGLLTVVALMMIRCFYSLYFRA